MSLADLRKEYTLAGLRRADLDPDPIRQFSLWMRQAIDAGVSEPTAMAMATVDSRSRPSNRTVLLKGVEQRGLIFFTNYESRKGRDLEFNPMAAGTVHWKELERQVCFAGSAAKLSREESEIYFNSRPAGSRLSTWVSRQTEEVKDRGFLEEQLRLARDRYPGDRIPMPPYWGGFCIAPDSIEFWQGRPNRLHDRFRYSRQSAQEWSIARLSP